jgi:uncharacterized protein
VRAILVDAGPLVALIEPTDRHHRAAVDALDTLSDPLVTVWPAYAEAMYLLGDSERSQHALWSMVEVGGLDFVDLSAADAPRMRVLMQTYRDHPMDVADAALVRVAERDKLQRIFTFDRRHFEVYRLNRRERFTVIP